MFGKKGLRAERGASRRALRSIAASLIAIASGHGLVDRAALADPAGPSYFFATRAACAASWIFNKLECDNAFANAEDEMRERAPGFATKFDCERRFRLCMNRASDAVAASQESSGGPFSPEMLGVEISSVGDGRVATPVLAVVNPPGMFRARPVSRLDPAAVPSGQSQIPRADRFESFRAGASSGARSSFETLSHLGGKSAEFTEPQPADPGPPESERARGKRRELLKNTPFVE